MLNDFEDIEQTLEGQLAKLSKRDKVSFIKRLEIRETMIYFANNYHTNTSGNPMRWDTFKHMVDIYQNASIEKDVVIMAGTQIGKTDWLVIFTLAAAYCGLNVLYVLPNEQFRDAYVVEKYLRPIKLSTFYQEILRDTTAKSRDLLHFGKGIIKFVGGKSEANFVGFSADILICDETDQLSVPKNIDLGMGRMNQSPHKLTRLVSNPSTAKGLINVRYSLSDKRVRMYPCTECKKLQELDFFENVVEVEHDDEGNPISHSLKDKNYQIGDSQDIKAMCNEEGCCGHLDRLSKDAEWVATAVSERGIAGYKMPSFCSPNVEIREVYNAYLDGLESASKMEAFYIKHIASPYSTAGNKVSEDILEKCTFKDEEYSFTLKEDQAYSDYEIDDKPCVMGIDTATDHFDISISHQEKIGDPETHRLVFLGKMNPQDGLFFLHDLVRRYNVVCAVIDIGPLTLEAMQFQTECDIPVWRCNFWNTQGRETELKEDIGQVNTNRREMLDKSYSLLKQSKLIMPNNYDEIFNGQYVKEMTALKRESEQNKRGVWIPRWVGSDNNHHRLSDSYRNLARELVSETLIIGKNTVFIR